MGTGGTTGIATAADNVAMVSVDFGLPNIGYLNGLFATITVCVPGTSNCQSIDHVLVNTGASGLRLLKPALSLSLPALTDDAGVPLAECTQFISGFLWGALQRADLKIAGEQATNLTVQVIDPSGYPVPTNCAGVDFGTTNALAANGILGVGSFLQDCGPACATVPGVSSTNPGLYYSCSSASAGGCLPAAVPLAKQVSNPVAFFGNDNNGTIVELPAISAQGATSVSGSLVFGIGTRDNNTLGGATVIPLDSQGWFLTKYPLNGSNSVSFLDSSSNAIYFLNGTTAGIPTCPSPYDFLYCPSATLNLSAEVRDAGGLVSLDVSFSIANARTLFASTSDVAFDNLGGPAAASSSMGAYFDWGLPFYFGRRVFTSIEGKSTPGLLGLFVAF
jgi:hypothetical protein